MEEDAGKVTCEVAWATSETQVLEVINVAYGTTVLAALEVSDICRRIDELIDVPVETLRLGIFGELVKCPADRLVHEGDRIEIYRPLQVDPKQARRARARRMA